MGNEPVGLLSEDREETDAQIVPPSTHDSSGPLYFFASCRRGHPASHVDRPRL